jgi:uncharacterized membrane protein YccC
MADIKPPLVSLSEHPRASYAIRRWKAIVSLAGFLVAAVGSWWNGVPLPDALLRGLIGGVAGYVVGGFAAVTVWRNMLQSEARIAVQRAHELRQRELERLRGAGGT